MPSFADIRREIASTSNLTGADLVRRKYLKDLKEHTGRPTVLYASAFGGPPGAASFNIDDVQLFMAALIDVRGPRLDLVLHSPGGSAEAVEQLVSYLRSKFSDIRVIVPQNAMSAATMLACAANSIVMGRHSALGPIDPQIVFQSESGRMAVPAQSILDEYQAAQEAIKKGDSPILWAQKIGSYPPGFLIQCNKLILLAKELVASWLSDYMFEDDPEGSIKAMHIAEWLANNKEFQTHGRPIPYSIAHEKGLRVSLLEDDQLLQEKVLSLFHSTIATFQATRCIKIVENHDGKGSYLVAQ